MIAKAVTNTPGTMLMKKIQRQSMVCVMKPPTVGPSVGARTETMPRIAGIIVALLARKKSEADGKYRWHHRAAGESLQHPKSHHRLEVPSQAAQQARRREQRRR